MGSEDDKTFFPKITHGDVRKWTRLAPLLWLGIGGIGTTGIATGLDLFGTRAHEAHIQTLEEMIDRLEAQRIEDKAYYAQLLEGCR